MAGIFLGVGALVLSEFSGTLDAETNDDNNTIATVNNSLEGLVELANFLPIIGLVVAAVILLGIVLAIRAR